MKPQGLYDIAWGRCFPGVVIAAAKDGPELAKLLRWAHELRLDEGQATSGNDDPLSQGSGSRLRLAE